jgi:hypothetical protein
MKHLHFNPPCCGICQRKRRSLFSTGINVGFLENKLPGQLPRFQRLPIGCSMQPYRLGQIRA